MEEQDLGTALEKETGRLEAFSDGVFAIAITLLVLELKVPALSVASSSPEELGNALVRQWPSYVGLVTSFFTILIMWVHHHAILRNVRRTDAWLHFANGCLLLGITLFPTPLRFWHPTWKARLQKWPLDSMPAHLFLWLSVSIFLFARHFANPCCRRMRRMSS